MMRWIARSRGRWSGAARTSTENTDWIRPLSAAALAEIDAALRSVQRRGLQWRAVAKDDFPLPGLLRRAPARPTASSSGGAASRSCAGSPSSATATTSCGRIWSGIGAHLGAAVHQNAHGELIGEVRDEVRLYGEVVQPAVDKSHGVTSRAKARSNGPLRWHTDRCDVVGLLCVRSARRAAGAAWRACPR